MCGFCTAVAKIPVGVAYAAWAALGTAIVSTVGMTVFGEDCNALKLACLLCIMMGVVGLNVLDDSH